MSKDFSLVWTGEVFCMEMRLQERGSLQSASSVTTSLAIPSPTGEQSLYCKPLPPWMVVEHMVGRWSHVKRNHSLQYTPTNSPLTTLQGDTWAFFPFLFTRMIVPRAADLSFTYNSPPSGTSILEIRWISIVNFFSSYNSYNKFSTLLHLCGLDIANYYRKG